jgi:hypothetical protein
MGAKPYSLEHVDDMIEFLDRAIAAGKDTPALLHGLQRRLDAISAAYKNEPRFDEFYSHMLELQALIYGRQNQDALAVKFMKEAVRQSGNVQSLRSAEIKQYIAEHVPAQEIGKPKHRGRLRIGLPRLTKKRAVLAAGVSLVVMLGAGAVFSPQTFGLTILTKYSKISAEKKVFEGLKAQYSACSSTLAQEKGSINNNDMTAVENYNNDASKCQSVLQQENQAAARYNSLIGQH